MRPQVISVSSVAASAPIPMDRLQVPFNVGFGVSLGRGVMTYTVEHTFDDILNGATATWFPNSTVTAQTTNKDGNLALFLLPLFVLMLQHGLLVRVLLPFYKVINHEYSLLIMVNLNQSCSLLIFSML